MSDIEKVNKIGVKLGLALVNTGFPMIRNNFKAQSTNISKLAFSQIIYDKTG